MAEKKECVHCHRSIDAVARVCPYCNRDQDAPKTESRAAVPLPPIENVPQQRSSLKQTRREWSTRALVIFAAVALLVASFAIGGLVYGLGRSEDELKEERPPQIAENSGRDREFPGLTLVPEADPTATIGRSITSAPIPDPDHKYPEYPAEYLRSDATALPSSEYARVIEQAKKQPTPPTPSTSVDPRTVNTPLPGTDTPRPPVSQPEPESTERPAGESSARSEEREAELEERREETRRQRVVRTDPVPIYQPLPRIKDRAEEIEESGTMRFRLTVSRDGSVDEIRVLETMPGMTGKMIAAIQKWKFKPATENGIPVDGTFMVDISFKAPE